MRLLYAGTAILGPGQQALSRTKGDNNMLAVDVTTGRLRVFRRERKISVFRGFFLVSILPDKVQVVSTMVDGMPAQ